MDCDCEGAEFICLSDLNVPAAKPDRCQDRLTKSETVQMQPGGKAGRHLHSCPKFAGRQPCISLNRSTRLQSLFHVLVFQDTVSGGGSVVGRKCSLHMKWRASPLRYVDNEEFCQGQIA